MFRRPASGPLVLVCARLMYSVPLAPPAPALAALREPTAPDSQRLLSSDEFQYGERCHGQERATPEPLVALLAMTGGK